MPRKITRTSGPVSTVAIPEPSTREMSCRGTGSTMSTSPDSSADTRVESLEIGVNTISSMLPSFLPQ